jgi:predicted nucleic acid-binding protein
VGGAAHGELGDRGSGSVCVIGADTSVLVRYLVGTPPAQARRAARLMDGEDEIGVSVVALAECAHVLRTQYEVGQADIIEALIGLVQKENVRVVDLRTDLAVELLVRARALPARPIPDALIVAASQQAGALPLATFDREQRRYGVATLDP